MDTGPQVERRSEAGTSRLRTARSSLHEPQASTYLYLPSAGISKRSSLPSCFCVFWGSNSSPLAHTASLLLTEIPPQPSISKSFKNRSNMRKMEELTAEGQELGYFTVYSATDLLWSHMASSCLHPRHRLSLVTSSAILCSPPWFCLWLDPSPLNKTLAQGSARHSDSSQFFKSR